MKLRPRTGILGDEKGVSLIEQVMAALFIGFLILVWVNSIRVTTKGTIQSKNNLRAQNLAMSKLEDVKNTALQASFGRTWNNLTLSATVEAYRTPQVSIIESKRFTWVVDTYYMLVPTPGPSISPGAVATPEITSAITGNVVFQARVSWDDVTGPKRLTMTGYAADLRQ